MKARPDEEILSTLKSRSDSYKTDHRLSAQQALGCTSIFFMRCSDIDLFRGRYRDNNSRGNNLEE